MPAMTDQHTVLRGKEAQMLLENPILSEVWAGIENEAVEALVACSMKPDAKDDRDALIWHLKMVRKQKGILFGMVEQGKFAQHKIDSAKESSTVKSLYRRVVNG
jgi:hypothetical protein